MMKLQRKWLVISAAMLVIVALAVVAWQRWGATGENAGLVSGNGRTEAVEIDVAAKIPGRVKEILVREGELVTVGQVVALMDTETLEAQRRQAEAELQRAYSAVTTAQSQLGQREAERVAAVAVVAQREAELNVAEKRAARSADLVREGASSQQEADDDCAHVESATAALSVAHAQVAAADAAIATSRARITGTESAVAAAHATVERIAADIADSELKAPRDGRVQYLVARAGEVVGSGGRVLNMVDLSDVYMTFFLPTTVAGRIALEQEVRLVLDAAPDYVFPATVSFVADVAQFTPKTVETAVEREKLMFRIRAQVPPEVLRKYITRVKTGLPGVAYVRIDSATEWPAHLRIKLPDERVPGNR